MRIVSVAALPSRLKMSASNTRSSATCVQRLMGLSCSTSLYATRARSRTLPRVASPPHCRRYSYAAVFAAFFAGSPAPMSGTSAGAGVSTSTIEVSGVSETNTVPSSRSESSLATSSKSIPTSAHARRTVRSSTFAPAPFAAARATRTARCTRAGVARGAPSSSDLRVFSRTTPASGVCVRDFAKRLKDGAGFFTFSAGGLSFFEVVLDLDLSDLKLIFAMSLSFPAVPVFLSVPPNKVPRRPRGFEFCGLLGHIAAWSHPRKSPQAPLL